MGKKTYRSCNLRNERISIKNCLPGVLRLSCVVHGPIYGRFMGFYVNSFLPGGTPHIKGVGMLVGKFELNP